MEVYLIKIFSPDELHAAAFFSTIIQSFLALLAFVGMIWVLVIQLLRNNIDKSCDKIARMMEATRFGEIAKSYGQFDTSNIHDFQKRANEYYNEKLKIDNKHIEAHTQNLEVINGMVDVIDKMVSKINRYRLHFNLFALFNSMTVVISILGYLLIEFDGARYILFKLTIALIIINFAFGIKLVRSMI